MITSTMYVKLYSSIINSSIWSEDSDTCKVWITMLALADRDGFVFGSVSGLARISAVDVEKVSEMIKKFLDPDPQSADIVRCPENQGRRLRVVEGGWQLLNYPHYRDLKDADARRGQVRAAVRKHRNQLKSSVNSVSPSEAYSESDTESEKSKNNIRRFAPPTIDEVREYAVARGYTFDAEAFVAYYEARGWKLGRNVMSSWKAACTTWAKNDASRLAAATTTPNPAVAPSGDLRLPTGGYAAADGSWFDYRGERYFGTLGGPYRTVEGYAPDGTHKQNTAYTERAKEIAERILAPLKARA